MSTPERNQSSRGASLVSYVLLLGVLAIGAAFSLMSAGSSVEGTISTAADAVEVGGEIGSDGSQGSGSNGGSGGSGDGPSLTTTTISGGGSPTTVAPTTTIPPTTTTIAPTTTAAPTTTLAAVAAQSVSQWAAGGSGSHPVSGVSLGGYYWDSGTAHAWLDWNTNTDRYELVQEGLAAQLNIASGADYSCISGLLGNVDGTVNAVFGGGSYSNSDVTSRLSQLRPYNTGAASC